MYINEAVLNFIYCSNQKISTQHDYFEIKQLSLGDICFPSGNIVAVDPDLIEDYAPYSTTVPPGTYPTSLFVAKDKHGDHRIAFTSIYLSNEKATRWEMAEFQNGGPTLDPFMDMHGFGVDSGKAAIMDQTVVDRVLMEDISLNDAFYSQMEETYIDTYSYAIGKLNSKSESNEVIIFDTGWGDGCYPAYFGYDSENNLCAFVIDCMILWEVQVLP